MTLPAVIGLWWAWLAAALVFGILEVLLPSYIFLGVAIGAAAMGGLMWLGLQIGATASLAVFAGLSLAAYLVLLWRFGRKDGQVRIITRDINENR
jgi:membrane protein implicated in regulation of membrane protease activity